MSPFAAMSLGDPPAGQKLIHDCDMRPAFNVLSFAELEGSGYAITGDGKGCVSAWHLALGVSQEEPDHYFEAHSGAICQVLPLKSARVPEVIEEKAWPEEVVGPASFAAVARRSTEASISSEDAASQVQSFPEPPKKASCMERFCGCLLGGKPNPHELPKLAKRGRQELRHWLVATAGEDGAIRVWRWRLATTRKEATWNVDFVTEWLSDMAQPLATCMEMPDGVLAVATRESADVFLVDPSTASRRWVLYGHTAPVTCLSLCADGRLVSGGMDGAVRLWANRARSGFGDKFSTGGFEQGAQSAIADAGDEPGLGDDGSGGADRTGPAALVWAQPGAESANAGVSSMAFFAHMHQEERSESVSMTLRVLVQRAENLPKMDIMSESDPYVTLAVVEGDISSPSSKRTRSQTLRKAGATVWNQDLALGLSRCFVNGQWDIPECSEIEFEVAIERSHGHEEVLARCMVSVQSALGQVDCQPGGSKARRPGGAGIGDPRPFKLYAPLGQGPFQDLRAAVLYLSFSQRSGELIAFVSSVDGMPSVGMSKIYVRATMKQTIAGKARRMPTTAKERTKIIDSDANPIWNQILEVEVPGCLRENTILNSPGVHLLFQVYDYDHMTDDDYIGSITLPLSDVRQYEDGQVQPFRIDLSAESGGSRSDAKKKRASEKEDQGARREVNRDEDEAEGQGLRGAASAGGAPAAMPMTLVKTSSEGRVAPYVEPKAPQLHLGFCLLTPCPVQLRCTVEHAMGMPLPNNKVAPYVRMRCVEGNPMLPHLTSFKTSVKPATLKPVWGERCVLPVPAWLVKASERREAPSSAKGSASVQAGWEHAALYGILDSYAICVDIHDRDILSADDLLGRAVVPFADAWVAAGHGRSDPYRLISSCEKAVLYLGFERTRRPDQLVVHVDRATRLPVGDAGRADPYAVIRLAEVDAFGEPTDRSLACAHLASTTEPAPMGVRSHAFRHEEVMDLPGGVQGGIAAMRPNWHVLFEVLDANSDPEGKEPVLAHASVPLSEVLAELKAAEEPKKSPEGLRERLSGLRSPIGSGGFAASKRPKAQVRGRHELAGEEQDSRPSVSKELVLAKVSKRLELGQAMGGTKQRFIALEGPAPQAPSGGGGGGSASSSAPPGQPQASAAPSPTGPPPAAREAWQQAANDAWAHGGGGGGPEPPSQPPATKRRPAGSGHEAPPEVHAAVQALSAGGVLPMQPQGSAARSVLLIRFQAVDRWQGDARGPRRPPARPMQGPSPITSLATLATSIVAGHEDGNIFVWDAAGATPRPLHKFSAHKAPVSCITYFPSLDCLITGGGCRTRGETLTDAVVRIWGCTSFDLRQSVPLHGATARVVQSVNIDEEVGKKTTQVPCLALSTDNRQQRLLQLLRVDKPKDTDM